MHTIILSAEFIEQEGRLRELIRIASLLGPVSFVSRSSSDKPVSTNHMVFRGSGKLWYLSFIRFCIQAYTSRKDVDIIIASNRKALLPARLLARILGRPITVYDAVELYLLSEMHYLTGIIGSIVEKLLVRKYDIVLCANQKRAEVMQQIYHLKDMPIVFENIRRLPNAPEPIFNAVAGKFVFLERYRWVLLSTCGGMLDRRPVDLVRAVGKAGEDYALVIVGDFIQKQRTAIMNAARESNCNSVFLVDAMPSEQLSALVKLCNIGVVSYGKMDFNNTYCASGKVYEFVFAGLPLLCTDNPPLIDFCRKYGVGVACNDFSEGLRCITEHYHEWKANEREFTAQFNIDSYRASVADALRARVEKFIHN